MIDITKTIDNFEGTTEQLKTIAQDVYELCSQGFDEDFINHCKSMLESDYDYLTNDQHHQVLHIYIEELIANNGNFKDGDDNVNKNIYLQRYEIKFKNPTTVFVGAATMEKITEIEINTALEEFYISNATGVIVFGYYNHKNTNIGFFTCNEHGEIINYGEVTMVVENGILNKEYLLKD